MASKDPTRILLVEDVPQVAQYIRGLFATQATIKLLDVLTDGSKVLGQVQQLRPDVVLIDAFVYHWRLWSIPELRDAMHEAGFKSTAVYPRTAGATDSEGNLYTHAIDDPTELGDSFNVFVVGR